MSTKYCLISDLHVGCHCNSENWHKIILEWGEWLKDELTSKGIHDIIMCGDFFDDRDMIGVKSLAVAGELMDMWSDFDIIMITGNHDLFYKNRTDVSSVSLFNGRQNVKIINDMETVKMDGKTVTFVPWGQDISKCQKSDVIFGHLEINGFQMMPGKVAEGKTAPRQLTSKAELIFSGHFHLNDERSYKNSKIIYIGSPYQQNWGERSNDPGYYIIDMGDLSYEFHENTVSPRHIKLTGGEDELKDVKIEGNFLAVDIDSDLDESEVEKFKNIVFKGKPMEVKFNTDRQKYISDADIEYDGSIDILEIMGDYVDGLDLDKLTPLVKDKLKELYKKYLR